VDVARYARQIALPEVGPDGQARICAARVAVVGTDLAAETATMYLRAAGVASVSPLPAAQGEGADVDRWTALLTDVDLVVRSGFDDDAMAGAAARLGLPVIVVRAQRDGVDLVAFARRPPAPGATIAAPVAAAAPPVDGPAAVLAGTLAAAEALHVLAGLRDPAPKIRHLRLPIDGRDPLVQEIGR
jgi:hypothetical protein